MIVSRTAIALGIVAGLAAVTARAKTAEFTAPAVGCPSKEGMVAVYEAAAENRGDFKTVQAVIEHYECEWIEEGVRLTLISQDPAFSVVVRPHIIGKDVWYYVPTNSVSVQP